MNAAILIGATHCCRHRVIISGRRHLAMTSLAPDFRGATLDRLRRSIAQALDLAALIEQGQAAMPLHDHFERLDGSVETAPLTLTVLGLNATSQSAALRWFCGTEYRILSADMPATFGLVEVHFGTRGYVLVNSGRRQEFDRLEPFLVAVRLPTCCHTESRTHGANR